MLDNGSSATCGYSFLDVRRGVLQLPVAFFVPFGETTDEAALRFADGRVERVRVWFGPGIREATFEMLSPR